MRCTCCRPASSRPNCVPVIGNGVVIDLSVLFEELDGLEARGVDTSKLLVSANAHVIPSYNRTIDKVTERFLGKRRIGTTGRGIGPTYADKMNRVGIRIQDLYDEGILRQKVEAALELKNQLLAKVYNTPRRRRRRSRRRRSGSRRCWRPRCCRLRPARTARGAHRRSRARC